MRRLLSLLLLLVVASQTFAAESLPPAPAKYFNDHTGTVRPETALALNSRLEQFEKDESSQVVVAMFSRLPANAALEDYANRLFRSWKIGQASKNNGILLLVFKDDRKLRIEVGYGLEGVLPDAVANQIITREIAPHFKAGDYDAGLAAGVNAILQAAKGEYQGSGRTVAQRGDRDAGPFAIALFFLLLFAIFAIALRFGRRGTQYHRRRRTYWGPIWTSGGGGGGWSSGGGGFSGGFSGGGGSSGGGGASGSW
jgi:uncharacterized protein